jgi:hypothetical protein
MLHVKKLKNRQNKYLPENNIQNVSTDLSRSAEIYIAALTSYLKN